MTEITVTGAAEQRIPANEAQLAASVSVRDASRDRVLGQVEQAHAKLVERARQLVAEGTALSYAADPISSYSNSWRDEKRRAVVEYQAHASVRIVLVELERVGDIAAELTRSGADVHVSWELSAETRRAAEATLRAAAVADARAAAEDYAKAIGASSAAIVSLRDGAGGGVAPLGMARFALADAGAAPEVTVGEITVSVSVEAKFRAE